MSTVVSSSRLRRQAVAVRLPSTVSVREDDFIWDEDRYPAKNYAALAKRLASSGDLFASACDGNGLLLVLPDCKHRRLTKGAELAPIIVDRVPVRVIKNGKPKGGKIDHAHLNAMLRSRVFLDQFLPADEITSTPLYLPDFSLARPGYNDGGRGFRILHVGPEADVSDSLAIVTSFLDVMEFETNADRTNTVAAALTVALRNHWPGGKPIILATATKSHAGKDTVISFSAGPAGLVSISYQATNWACERSFVGAVKTAPDAALIVVENARLDRKERFIASAFLERFATDPEPMLFSTGTGEPIRIRNNLVLGISTNYGTVTRKPVQKSSSLDSVHLEPVVAKPVKARPAKEAKSVKQRPQQQETNMTKRLNKSAWCRPPPGGGRHLLPRTLLPSNKVKKEDYHV